MINLKEKRNNRKINTITTKLDKAIDLMIEARDILKDNQPILSQPKYQLSASNVDLTQF